MASPPVQPAAHDLFAALPKEHTRGPPTPPPAYFPRPVGPLGPMNPSVAAQLAAAAGVSPLQPAGSSSSNNNNRLASGWQDINDLSDDEDDGDRSAITVRISTAVRITGDNNILHVAADPATTARFVAEAVTRVLRGGGAQERGGIPMIDEEGRPRPVRIEIEAGTEVHGEGNVLGGKELVMRALGKRRREMEHEEEEEDEEQRALQRRCRRSASV